MCPHPVYWFCVHDVRVSEYKINKTKYIYGEKKFIKTFFLAIGLLFKLTVNFSFAFSLQQLVQQLALC
jgi:hypothetical protein